MQLQLLALLIPRRLGPPTLPALHPPKLLTLAVHPPPQSGVCGTVDTIHRRGCVMAEEPLESGRRAKGRGKRLGLKVWGVRGKSWAGAVMLRRGVTAAACLG